MSQSFARARFLIGLTLALTGLGVTLFFVLEKGDEPEVPVAAKARPDAPSIQPSPRSTPDIDAKPVPAKQPESAKKLDREASDRMRAQIQSSLDHSGSPAPRSADPASAREAEAPSDAPPELDPEYIRERIREDLLPVAIECYESALADEPELAGKLVMNFVILGDPEVGGVVDDATVVDDQSTLANEFVRECMRESLMAVNFDAPSDGGRVEVTYPFEFAPGEDDG